jgi:hypothetical protein
MIRRADITLIAKDGGNNSSQKDGVVLARVQFTLTAEAISGGQGTELRPGKVSKRSRTDGRTVKRDAKGIIRPNTVVTGSGPRLLTAC